MKIKQNSLFVANYGLGLAMLTGLIVTLEGTALLLRDLGIRNFPVLDVVYGHKFVFLILYVIAFIGSVILSLKEGVTCAYASLILLNIFVLVFSLTVGLAITPLFCVVDNIGTAESGPLPGYPFPGFRFLLPACCVAIFTPFYIFSVSLIDSRPKA